MISTVGSTVGSTVKPMFTQFDCQSNSSTNCPVIESTVGPTVHQTVRSIFKLCKCAITLVGKLSVITGKSLKLAVRCPVSGCWPSCYKNCQRQSCSAINCLSSGINILAGGSSVPLISERKGTDPHWKHVRCTDCLIARQPNAARQ